MKEDNYQKIIDAAISYANSVCNIDGSDKDKIKLHFLDGAMFVKDEIMIDEVSDQIIRTILATTKWIAPDQLGHGCPPVLAKINNGKYEIASRDFHGVWRNHYTHELIPVEAIIGVREILEDNDLKCMGIL